jgi:hypothetical protein
LSEENTWIVRVALSILLLLPLACVSPVLWIKKSEVPELDPGYGLLVFDLDTNVYVNQLATESFVAAKQVARGTHLAVLAVKAGSYEWTVMEFPGESTDQAGASGYWKLELWRYPDRDFDFEVRDGRTSYGGQLFIREDKSGYSRFFLTSRQLDARIINRSATVLHALETDYPGLLEKYPFEYTGEARDDFYPLLQQAREAGRR